MLLLPKKKSWQKDSGILKKIPVRCEKNFLSQWNHFNNAAVRYKRQLLQRLDRFKINVSIQCSGHPVRGE